MRAVRITMAIVAAALLLPHACSSPFLPSQVGYARLYSGDEPHYLVLLNSIVRDGDLDVSNNYRAVHRGDDQAGEHFKLSPLDHHTAWVAHGQYTRWSDVYEFNEAAWGSD